MVIKSNDEFIDALMLKSALIDALYFHKNGEHIDPNFQKTKRILCNASGLEGEGTISNTFYIKIIGSIYCVDNQMPEAFDAIVRKYGLEHEFNSTLIMAMDHS